MSIDSGTWTATAVSSEIVPASNDRLSVVIQLTSGNNTQLGIGEDAVFGEGLQLTGTGSFIEIKGHQARMAINAICDSGNSSSGGYQDS